MSRIRSLFALVFVMLAPAIGVPQERDLTLEQVRQRLEGQQIMLMGREWDSSRLLPYGQRVLMPWGGIAGDAEEGFRLRRGDHAPLAIREKTATVLKVQEAEAATQGSVSDRTDAFGRSISENRANPSILIVVQLPGETIRYGVSGHYSTLMGSAFLPMSTVERNRKEIGEYLQSLVGKKLYPLGYTKIYRADAALADLLDYSRRALARDRSVPNLTPLTVIETKYLEGENAAVVRAQTPTGENKLLFSSLELYETTRSRDETPLKRIGFNIEERSPVGFSAREIAAIKQGEIFKGMSRAALFASWGFPDNTNDWGQGGRQYVYGKSQFVYEKELKVTDWQSLR